MKTALALALVAVGVALILAVWLRIKDRRAYLRTKDVPPAEGQRWLCPKNFGEIRIQSAGSAVIWIEDSTQGWARIALDAGLWPQLVEDNRLILLNGEDGEDD